MILLEDKIRERIKKDLLLIDPNIITSEKDERNEHKVNDNLQSLKKQVKPASFNIRVGKKYAKEGASKDKLSKYEKITIEPFEVVVIETYEKIRMPLNLIGRWNIRVKLAYKGLVWVGGPQVDPGYDGYLYCPIYNLSDKPVELKYKDGLATMDFSETTDPTDGFVGFDKVAPDFEFYKNENLTSALITLVSDKLKEIEDFKEKQEEKIHKLQTTLLTVVGALFATLSILIISMKDASDKNLEIYPLITYVAIFISVISLLSHGNVGESWYKKVHSGLKKLLLFGLLTLSSIIVFTLIYFFITH